MCTVSGRIDSESIAELERLFLSEANGHHVILDLKDLTLANQDAINVLERCEAGADSRSRIAQHTSVNG